MRAGVAVVLAGFGASRVLAWTLGVRFDSAPLGYFWQYLDPRLLREDLLGSLFYLHTQPPAFNALLGLVLKLGGDPTIWFALLYHGLGLGMALVLLGVLVRLGTQPVRAGIAVAIFSASPTVVLYENWLFYTHVVAVLLVVATWLLQSLAESARMRDAVLFSFVVAVIATTRSLFHLVWVVAALGAALWLVSRRAGTARRVRIALAMAPALLLVVGVYAKNAILFDNPSASTWVGMSLAKLTTHRLDAELREDLVRAGELSSAAKVRPFSPLSHYPPELVSLGPYGHPALDRQRKPGNYVNYNHGAYVQLNRIALGDALRSMALYPGTYVESIGLASLRYAIPPSQYRFLRENHAAYAPIDRIFEVLTGVPEAFGLERRKEALGDPDYLVRRIRWLYLAASVLAIAWALMRSWQQAQREGGRSEAAVLLFCIGSLAWVAVVANALELGENQRFQAMVEPLHFVLIAWMCECAFFGRRVGLLSSDEDRD